MKNKYKITTEYKIKNLDASNRTLFDKNVNDIRNGKALSDISIIDLPLVGPKLANFLTEKGVNTLEELIVFNPRGLKASDLSTLTLAMHVTVKQKVAHIANVKKIAKLICSAK